MRFSETHSAYLKSMGVLIFISERSYLKKATVNFFKAQEVAINSNDLEIDTYILLYHLKKVL